MGALYVSASPEEQFANYRSHARHSSECPGSGPNNDPVDDPDNDQTGDQTRYPADYSTGCSKYSQMNRGQGRSSPDVFSETASFRIVQKEAVNQFQSQYLV